MKVWTLTLSFVFLLSCAHASSPLQAQPPAVGETVVQESPARLEQLVAPIALYPDALIAQLLAACTYPTEIVEADRWMEQHSTLQGEQRAKVVDQQPWDASVKALTQYPSILANLDKNLSWASALGDAYVNDEQALLDAVQGLRRRAQQAGNLKSTPQEVVTTQGSTIVIQPASPDVVYVPTYDPWGVFGAPIAVWPGWYWSPELYTVAPGISYGIGFGIGSYLGFGWGWHHWDADWRARRIAFDHNVYVSHSRTFLGPNHFYRGGPGFRGRVSFRGPGPVFHGSERPDFGRGMRSGAFSGSNHGGGARSFAARGAFSARGRFGSGFHGGHR
jgi:hypothetical protein